MISKTASHLINWLDSDYKKEEDAPLSEKFEWVRLLPFIVMHLACFSVFFIAFSWWAVAIAAVSYLVRMFAITAFYHRYFSHRSFKTHRFWQFCFAVLGATSVQRGALWWAAHHRQHHKVSDEDGDLHSPVKRGFIWSHMGWFCCEKNFHTDYSVVKDLSKYPELVFLNRFDWIVPLFYGIAMYGLGAFMQFGLKMNVTAIQIFVYGFLLSTVVLFHGTFTINSLAHIFGTKRFKTEDNSRNNAWLALITLGEGWHNNHHHYPYSTRQGFKWWEIDITYYTLKTLSWLGVVHSLKPVPQHIKNR